MSGPIEAFRLAFGGRAAGLWRVEGAALIQVAFAAAADMPADVAATFAAATRVVPLDRRELGIVAAFAAGAPVVSVAADLPADLGSGYWLRAFHAACSVAVPIGPPPAVLSIALPTVPADPAALAAAVRAFATREGWGEVAPVD